MFGIFIPLKLVIYSAQVASPGRGRDRYFGKLLYEFTKFVHIEILFFSTRLTLTNITYTFDGKVPNGLKLKL